MHSTETTLLAELILKQRQHANFFFDQLDREQLEIVASACANCPGAIIVTGVGKSGIIAEKVAMSLASTGTRSFHLPASNFLHGDIGGSRPGDIVLMLSKSGETWELLSLLPHLRRKGVTTIAAISNKEGRLGKEADLSLFLPVERELCPFDLAPTTSTTAQLFFGDLLAIALMVKSGFGLEAYADNHPSGAIGKQISLRVRDLMKVEGDVPLCYPGDRLIDILVELSNKKCGALLVVDREQHLVGIFTDGDLRRALQQGGARVMERGVETFMSLEPIFVSPADLAWQALKKMQGEKYVTVAPVLERGKVVGIIRMHDIVEGGK